MGMASLCWRGFPGSFVWRSLGSLDYEGGGPEILGLRNLLTFSSHPQPVTARYIGATTPMNNVNKLTDIELLLHVIVTASSVNLLRKTPSPPQI